MGTTYRELFKLYDLIQNGDVRCVEKFLKDSTADLNMILPCKGIGILHLAVGIEPLDKSKRCTELILKHGGDPNLSNDEGITPVHIAAIWGKVDNLKLLIGCGGDPCRQDFDGISAFDYAVREQQWEVYDYLHNVIDESDDSIGSECAYTLDLERILVTTDEVVAEYTPMDEEPIKNTLRKSEMTRDWCDKNTLVINKLYPTILADTYILDDTDWNSTNLPKTSNILNDTSTTFKTCCTDKTFEISGVRPLENTLEKSKRSSVYENFSLPGSPNSIVHKNYKTRTCLKSNKETIEPSRIDLDKALAVVQNRTNEWLSSCSDLGESLDTRRSSSGVSSHLSGSIMLANVEEEYKYEDKEEDVVLIERRLRVSSIVLPLEESSPNDTSISLSSLPPSVEYDVETLRAELMALGCNPGPITKNTKNLYLKKLHALKKRNVVIDNGSKCYSKELQKSLQTDEWMENLAPYIELQDIIKKDFSQNNKTWREGNSKKSFTYLLLDPRVTGNLPARAGNDTKLNTWNTFVDSIFYVGKGKRSRPYAHLYQALNLWKKDFKTSKDKKVQTILDIWSSDRGVVCLHVFQNVIPAEAYTHEAAIIDAIGLKNLGNVKNGNYYGVASSWGGARQRALGVCLLYKAMLIFLSEGERQLGPGDM